MFYTDPFINSIAKIVDHILKALDMYSQDAFDLVMRTGMQESKFKHLEQLGDGPAQGFFQVELDTANDIWYNYLVFKESLRDKLRLIVPMGPWDDFTIMSNIALQVALCRLHYRRFRDPLPFTIDEQAEYYKRFYNTLRGKATVEEFISNAKELEKLKPQQ
ncbi:hypothetical protein LCGC14_1909520 [marine sediment metagenome]|uniref:Uncharacterized protein n=1 Tax=marine sediment metagenome TaxID=412755 RepID=A0A0F9IS42_9ZZZZ